MKPIAEKMSGLESTFQDRGRFKIVAHDSIRVILHPKWS